MLKKEESLSSSESQQFSRRDIIIRSTLSIPFISLALRLWDMQVIEGKKFLELSKGNRIRLKSFSAPRGIIYDRNQIILAKNIPAYNLILTPEDCVNEKGEQIIEEIITRISNVLHISYSKLVTQIKRNKTNKKFYPITLYENLTWYQMSLINAFQENFPGVDIDILSRRFYPFQESAVHILGYLNKITDNQLKKLPKNKIKSSELSGQAGLEKILNNELTGFDGGKQIEVNSVGRTIHILKNLEPTPGHDVITTIDHQLQQFSENLLKGKKGSIIVTNPHNGEILTLANQPAFDPNEFSRGISKQKWDQITNDQKNVLLNKSIQGTYSPGSTFKTLVGIAALETGLIQPEDTFDCKGYIKLGRNTHRCWKLSGHGNLNIVEALQHSCNPFFYQLGLELGIEKISEFAINAGFGKPTGIHLTNEMKGLVPTKEWKEKKYHQKWTIGDTVSISIGQGYLSVTPLQLINYINSIINGGYWIRPKMIKNIQSIIDKKEVETNFETNSNFIRSTGFDYQTLEVIKDGMRRNVQEKNGTGRRAYSKIIDISGKTGTTQVISYSKKKKLLQKNEILEDKYKNHAWFVAYAPSDYPIISSVVLLENGESGKYAAGLTKKLFEYYFKTIDNV